MTTLRKRYSREELAPYIPALNRAEVLLSVWANMCSRWREPAVNLGEHDEIELDWAHCGRTLGIYVPAPTRSIEFLKAWGSDCNDDMKEGRVASHAEFVVLWRWLLEAQ